MNKVTTQTAEIWWDKDGFSREHLVGNVDMTMKHVVENLDTRLMLSSNNPHPALIDIRDLFSISNEAKEYGKSELMINSTTALAIVIDNLSHRLIGNFFMTIVKPPYPTQLFTSEKNAVQWLKTYTQDT